MVGGVCAWREHLNNIVISMKPNVCDTPLSIYNKMMFLQLHEESRVKGGVCAMASYGARSQLRSAPFIRADAPNKKKTIKK